MNFQFSEASIFKLLIIMVSGLVPINYVVAQVIINEIAWMGTEASYNDEWIELYNNTNQDVHLAGWALKASDGSPEIQLSGIISAYGFYLLERTNDETVPIIIADQIYTGALNNSGETLQLYDQAGIVIDTVDCSTNWFAGDNKAKQTMERISPLSGSHPDNWTTSQNPSGTPKAQNSLLATQAPEQSIPKPEPQSIPEPEPESPSELEPEYATTTVTLSEAKGPVVSPLDSSATSSPQNDTGVESQPGPAMSEKTSQTYASGITINEILPSPDGADAENEWIELYNQNTSAKDISLWQLIDTIGRTKSYVLPEGTKIEANGFLLLKSRETGITLNNDGDTLKLLHPDANVVGTITFPKARQGQSYNHTQDDWQWSSTPSPGSPNIIPVAPVSPPEGSLGVRGRDSGNSTHTDMAGVAAIGKIFEQTENKNNEQFWLVVFIAAILSLFSGAIILFLKTTLKSKK